ncbi:tRNA (cytidine(34)-2'-O)-methyltransferase [Mobiluncus mulieris]|uniref:tRNA (cytidine(34)-2'-O)-methyltransferase n=1 Tax=Mobiluncus mulieris TaxID=2052 RepID=UPI0024323C34|nr:tRNA (cytidine(34)-2'-O)-methyltransferase [Mobiluncus mulieris]
MLHVIFYQPRIAGNTGAAIRLAACTGATLHVVEPTVFDFEDTKLKRAGLDYHDLAHLQRHPDLDDCFAAIPGKIYAFTGHTEVMLPSVHFQDGDALMFGPEDTGLPVPVMDDPRVTSRVRIPMLEGRRSLNLAISAAVGLYFAWGQLDYVGGV